MGNLLTSIFPFALASLLVLGVLLGSRLPEAQRKFIGWSSVVVLMLVTMALLAWLFLHANKPKLLPSLFLPLAILLPNLARIFVRTPRARRIFLAVGGVIMIAIGVTAEYVLIHIHETTPFHIFQGSLVFVGAMMIAAAWGNWLPQEQPKEEESPWRPALGRPLRHFGETS
jgi:hypothetical protein